MDLLIELKAPAEDNKANKELIKFLARMYNTNTTYIHIISGQNKSIKSIKIQNESN